MAATRPQPGDVTEIVDGIQDEGRRRDCRALTDVMRGITGALWGSSMVGSAPDREVPAELIERPVAYIDQVDDPAGGAPRLSELPTNQG